MNTRQRNRFPKFLWAICLVMVMVLCHAPQAYAASPTVEASTLAELQAAIDTAADGDVIGITDMIHLPANTNIGDPVKHIIIQRVDTGTYTGLEVETTEEASTIHIQNVTFDGNNVSNDSFFIIKGEIFFDDVNFINCNTPYAGGAVQMRNGNASFNNCVFDNNKASMGGHISMNSIGTLNIKNCTFTNGYSTARGGAIVIGSMDSICTIESSIIKENKSDEVGGGILNGGNLTIEGTKIYNNIAKDGGADIANTELGKLSIKDSLASLIELFAAQKLMPDGWFADSNPTEQIIIPGEVLGTSLLQLKYKEIEDPTPEPDPTPTPTPDPEPVTPPSSNHNGGGSSHSSYTPPTVTPTVPVAVKTPVVLSSGKAILDTTKTEYLLGYTDGLLGKQDTVTKAQLAQIVYRLLTPESKASVRSEKSSFKDVASNAWYNEAVSSMANAGLISMGADGKFNPDKNVTWGEMVTILAKFVEPNSKRKIITRHWAKDALNTAISWEFIDYNDQFNPDGEVTRVEMLNFINAMFTWTKQ